MSDTKTTTGKVEKSEAEWRRELTPMQYAVLREKATERPFSGEYEHEQRRAPTPAPAAGRRCCSESDAKFDSGCGWPSFTAPARGQPCRRGRDVSHGMIRHARCCARNAMAISAMSSMTARDPTGLRYCINSAALKLAAEINLHILRTCFRCPARPTSWSRGVFV